jgi:hypothetical protein
MTSGKQRVCDLHPDNRFDHDFLLVICFPMDFFPKLA